MRINNWTWIGLLAAVFGVASAAEELAGWPQWRGPNRDGMAARSPVLAANWSQEGPVKRWESEELPSGTSGGFSSLIVSSGRVYAYYYMHNQEAGKNVFTDGIFCVSASDGKTLWKKEFKDCERGYIGSGTPSSTPCVADGRLFVLGGGGKVYGLDSANGTELWQAKADGGLPAGTLRDWGIMNYSSILAADGLVLTNTGSGLLALDAKKGGVVWKQEQVKCDKSSPVIWKKDGKTFVLCNTPQSVHCLEAATGKLLWSVPGGGMSTPLVAGDTMVVLTGTALVAYRLALSKPEKELWTVAFGASGCSPVALNGHVYAITCTDALCVNLESGKPAWEQRKIGKDAYQFGAPAVADGKIIANMMDGKLLAMIRATPDKFDLLAQVNLNMVPCTVPAIAGGDLFLRMCNGRLACFDLTSAPAAKAK